MASGGRSSVHADSFGVRWQAQRDTALDSPISVFELHLKRRRAALVGALQTSRRQRDDVGAGRHESGEELT